MANNFKNLEVWKISMELAEEIYMISRKLPKEEIYGITSQLRRCAVSIPSNIAEGSGRRSAKDFIRFLNIATGSLSELETQLILCEKFKYISNVDTENANKLISRVGMMLTKLRQSLDDKR